MQELQINENRNEIIIAQEINIIKEQTSKILLQSSMEIGKRLKEAKEFVGHGNWGTWLETSVNYSQKTAQNLIKIYEEYGEKYLESGQNSNTKSIANLTYTQALVMLKLETEERENFIQNNDLEHMTIKKLEVAIAEKIAAENEKKELEKKLKKINEENEKLKTKMAVAEDLQEKLDELKKNQSDPKEIEKLKAELNKAKSEISDLKNEIEELEAKDDVPTVVEKEVIPNHITEKIATLETKLSNSAHTAKFKASFDVLVTMFNDLLETLESIRQADDALYEQYKTATNKLLNQLMIE